MSTFKIQLLTPVTSSQVIDEVEISHIEQPSFANPTAPFVIHVSTNHRKNLDIAGLLADSSYTARMAIIITQAEVALRHAELEATPPSQEVIDLLQNLATPISFPSKEATLVIMGLERGTQGAMALKDAPAEIQ